MVPGERRSRLKARQIAERLARCETKLDRGEQELALALLRQLAEGEPVDPARLAETVAMPEAEARECLERWHGVQVDAEDRIVAFGGLSLLEGPHRLRLDGPTLYAWCAWDTLFLPELIGSPADVESRCPTTGLRVSLRVDRDGPRELSSPEAVLSFLLPGAAYASDVISGFCRRIHFFASPPAAAAWTAKRRDTFVISIAEGFEIGRLTNAARFGHTLAT